MATRTMRELQDAMVNVLNHAIPTDNKPRYFLGDIIRDMQWLNRPNFQTTDKFVWFIGEMGTHIADSAEIHSAIISSYGNTVRFLWNGKEFKRLEAGEACPL